MSSKTACCAAALLIALLFDGAASAATITVNTTNDVVNAGDGACSLREAITAVNMATASGVAAGECAAGDSNADTIIVPAGTYTLSLTGADEANNASGDLNLRASVTIKGAGIDDTIVDASGLAADPDRVFDVPVPGINIALQDLAIINGHAPDASTTRNNGEDGGGMRINGANVTLTNVAVRNNQAGAGNAGFPIPLPSGNGGGIDIVGGNLVLAHSIVAQNACSSGGFGNASGGGIYARNTTVTMNYSQLDSNTVGDGFGGGISCDTGCALAIGNSSVTGNTANFGGGGIYANGSATSATNSTIAQNISTNFAAGLYVVQQTAQQADPQLDFVTLSGNQGNGFAFYSSISGTAQLRNSILAGNTGSDCVPSGDASFGSLGYNFSGTGCPVGANDIDGASNALRLGSLSLDESSATLVMLPHPDSPAINAGDCAASNLYVDQRGVTRPAGVPHVTYKFDGCDIGAAELGDDIFWDGFGGD